MKTPIISILASVVRKCHLLHTLSLEWNSIGQCDAEFAELCNAIASNRCLTRLDFRNNQLSNGHGLQLAQLILTNPSLRVLDLRWNRKREENCLIFHFN
jgi:Ran GTPase-activating protein (RanGAP) involved in mRNA processing and transport